MIESSSGNGYLRTLLILGRTSNLPTVWSNCLAAWLLGRGGEPVHFILLMLGATFVYVGGMFLNDAFDADFDRQFKRDRPIASGRIPEGQVWAWGWSLLGVGTVLLMLQGRTPTIYAILLAAFIVFYNWVHKRIAFSPVIMAACRWALFLVASSSSNLGITGLSMWSAFALAAYIVGLTYIARKETIKGPLRYWPCLPLAGPVILAVIANTGEWIALSAGFIALLLGWIAWCLQFVLRKGNFQIGRSVSGLLAGIVIVDAMAVLGGGSFVSLIAFGGLFALALLAQRFIPAT